MLLLVSDANILMDVEEGDLLASMFSLGYQFAVPDILYVDELRERHAHLLKMGLKTMTLSESSVSRVNLFSQMCVFHHQRDRHFTVNVNGVSP